MCVLSPRSNEDKVRKMEKRIIDLVDESCLAYEQNDSKLVRKDYLSMYEVFKSKSLIQALEKAEEAMQTDKSLGRYREEQNMNESDLNLTGSVCITRPSFICPDYFYNFQVILHCANMYTKCGMNTEALNQYNVILKNKLIPVHNRM